MCKNAWKEANKVGSEERRKEEGVHTGFKWVLPELQMVCTGIEPLKWREQLRAASRLQQPLRWILGETILKLLIWDYN